MTTTSITFDLSSSDYNAHLGFDVLLDNDVVFTVDHVAAPASVAVDVSDDDGVHELKFVLNNKTQEHTKVDEQGNITSDAMLSIKNVAFDEVELGHVFFEQTVYCHDTNGTQSLSEYKFYGNMGCNGYVSLKFTTPAYIWLMEHM